MSVLGFDLTDASPAFLEWLNRHCNNTNLALELGVRTCFYVGKEELKLTLQSIARLLEYPSVVGALRVFWIDLWLT